MCPHRFSRGFTLVESLIVIVVLALAGSAIVALQANLFSRQTSVSDVQVRTQLQLECAEQILATRKYMSDGYETIGTTYTTTPSACSGITALSGYSVPSVAVNTAYSGSACPLSGNCTQVTITQTGASPITFLLVDF